MKLTTTHKVLGAAAVLLLGSAALGKKKYDDYNEVIEKLEFEIDDIHNVRTSGLKLLFDVNILFKNPTNIDFHVDTYGVIAVKKVKVFKDNVLLGEANSNITQFQIQAFGTLLLKNITIETKYLSFLSELSNLASYSDLSKYKLEIVAEALGKTYVIEQHLA